jgi:hypothetical protein
MKRPGACASSCSCGRAARPAAHRQRAEPVLAGQPQRGQRPGRRPCTAARSACWPIHPWALACSPASTTAGHRRRPAGDRPAGAICQHAPAALGPARGAGWRANTTRWPVQHGLTPTQMALAFATAAGAWPAPSSVTLRCSMWTEAVAAWHPLAPELLAQIDALRWPVARPGPVKPGDESRPKPATIGFQNRTARVPMANLIVHGGTPLTGRIVPSANKNAVLPILCATLLTREPVRLVGIPEITDVRKILEIFRTLGSRWRWTTPRACWTCTTRTRSSTPNATTCPRRCARPSCWCRRCWRALAWRASKTTCRAAPWACARSTRTWR